MQNKQCSGEGTLALCRDGGRWPLQCLIAWLRGPSSLGAFLYPGPVTADPGNKMSGCFPALRELQGDTAKALWEPRRQSYFIVRGETGLHGEGSVWDRS